MSGELDSTDVSQQLAAAEIFCLPSFAEGIPISIMEAMATGLPVVTTYVGGIPELAIDGETALVVPASNALALAEAIERLVTDGALRERLVASGRQRVSELHDIRRNAEQLRQLFAGVAPDGL
jgi:glycosyltransferase involved in cell wall biosynthesis